MKKGGEALKEIEKKLREQPPVRWDLSKENLREALKEIRDVVGERWATDHRAVTITYSRDFTPTPGKAPNIVVMPASTEEVVEIVKIAHRRNIPFIPYSTGFNHGGLTLPRWGGILLDLKRMNKIEVDAERMTCTIGPGARNAEVYLAVNEHLAHDGVKLRACLPLTMGSISTLANYVARGGPGIAIRYGLSSELIAGMTWVLPDGQVLRLGVHAEGAERLPLNWHPLVDIMGIFVAADGGMGVCTEMTIRIVPEYPVEKLYIFDADDRERALESALEFDLRLSREEIAEFIYKSHHGQMAVAAPVDNPLDLADYLPSDPVIVIISGHDEEELAIKEEILMNIAESTGMYAVDQQALLFTDEPLFDPRYWKLVGPRVGAAMKWRGSFNWTAGNVKMDLIPLVHEYYRRLIHRYWKDSAPDFSEKMALTGTAVQGPYPFARLAPLEFDYWWDQGNPEDIKRAAVMLKKTTEMFVEKFKATMYRRMYGFGEIEMPRAQVYWELAKRFKAVVDELYISHPGVNPLDEQ